MDNMRDIEVFKKLGWTIIYYGQSEDHLYSAKKGDLQLNPMTGDCLEVAIRQHEMLPRYERMRGGAIVIAAYMVCSKCQKMAQVPAQLDHEASWNGGMGHLKLHLVSAPEGWKVHADHFGYATLRGLCEACSHG